jgi:hypothetical protein
MRNIAVPVKTGTGQNLANFQFMERQTKYKALIYNNINPLAYL